MNIIIVGCSNVGETLAAQLSREDNNVTMIDLSGEKIDDVTAKYDIMGIVGNGATYVKQREAGIKSADLLIAVTDSDELNLLCCMIAKKNSRCRVIARVTSPEYNGEIPYLKDELGLEMIINPEYASAEEIARLIRFPSAMKIETFMKGRIELLTFRLPDDSPLVGMAVKEVVTKLKCNILVCTVERENDSYIPNGDFTFKGKDAISIVASPTQAYSFFKKIDYRMEPAKSVMLMGGTEMSHYVCELLRKDRINIKIIENDKNVCDRLCRDFPEVTVINGDETDQSLFIEEGISDTDVFATLTDTDEENILMSLFAKKYDGVKIITKINRSDYESIVKGLALDTTVYPKNITSDMIVKYVRATKNAIGSNLETMYNVIKDKVEACEFKVLEGSPITGKPLSELKFKDDVIVAQILRGRRIIIPRGHDVIEPGDSVIIVSKHLGLRDIYDVLNTQNG